MWLLGPKTLNDCGIMNDEEAEFYEWSHKFGIKNDIA
jgi:hypothetical protein